MAKTNTKIAVLIQVMDELGFDREIIGKVTKIPQRTISDIVNWRGCWARPGELNELRESYRLYLRRCILDEAAAIGLMVLKRFEEMAKNADLMTTMRIANTIMSLVAKMDDGR